MNDKQQLVMILEKSNFALEPKEEYTLEGVFAEFGKENNNNRIYEEKEYLPHLDYLKKKIKAKNLVGELDHPEKFEASLNNASHIIEDIQYVAEKRQIVGKIRLLTTAAGKNARALLDDGVQLSISSRAAGIVKENKKVEIKKIFTYDLVADPGFENAKLHKINENLGITSENIAVFEMEDVNLLNEFMDIKKDEKQNNLNKNMNNTDNNIALNEYSKVIKDEIQSLDNEIIFLKEENEKIQNYLKNDLNENFKEIENKISNISVSEDSRLNENGESLTPGVENYIDDVISPAINKIEEFLDEEVMANTATIRDFLNEEVSKNVTIIEDFLDNEVAESITNLEDFVKEFSTDLVEYKNENERYKEIFEKYDEERTIDNEKIVDLLNLAVNEINSLANFNNFLGENLKSLINFVEKNINENSSNDLKTEINTIKENQEKYNKNSIVDLKNQVNSILDSVQNKKQEQTTQTNFSAYYNILSEENKKAFMLLAKDQKEKVINQVLNLKPMSEQQILKIWENVVKPVSEEEFVKNLIGQIPDNLQENWNKLSNEDKNKIVLLESQNYNLNSPALVRNFWETRRQLVNTYYPSDEHTNIPRINENNSADVNVKNQPTQELFFSELKKRMQYLS